MRLRRAAQAGFHDAVGDEEGDDDEQHAGVGEAREGLGGIDRAGEHRGRDRQHRGGQERERVQDDGENRGREDGEEVPRLTRQPRRNRRQPDAERQGERHALLDQRAASEVQRRHLTGLRPTGGCGRRPHAPAP